MEIRPAEPCRDLPQLLAAPGYAVSAGRPRLHWRIGTGPFRPGGLHLEPGELISCRPNVKHPDPPTCEQLLFSRDPQTDRFDRLMAGADAFLLRDPSSLRYYTRLEDLRILPLAWDRLYFLCGPVVAGSGIPSPRRD